MPDGLMMSCSASDECQDVRIDHVGIRGHHAVWETGVEFERPMLEQLSLQQRSVFVGHNLVIVALHYEGRYRDRSQIVRLVSLRESLDAFVMSERAAHHPLTPPVLDNSLRSLRTGSVETVKRP